MKRTISVLLLLSLTSVPLRATDDVRERPNILFFLVDDMGSTDTSVRFLRDLKGKPVDAPLNRRYRTPNMERLAAQGRIFTNARACSVCSPTRVSLMTGKDAARLHVTTWTHPKTSQDTGVIRKNGLTGPKWSFAGMNPTQTTLPRLLATAGYRTIHCGKAHFGPDDSPAGDPKSLGFAVNIGGYGGGGPGSYWGMKNFSAAWRKGGHDWDVPGLAKYHGTDTFLTEALTRELAAELTSTSATNIPFFAYMAHYAVHAPFEADARFAANYPDLKGDALAFATLVEGMDKSLGDLLDHLQKIGQAEKTLVIFYSDNGSDGPANTPLRGKKGTRFEGGCRVPMIAAWAKPDPSHPLQKAFPIPAGSEESGMVTPADFLPTLTAIAGAAIPQNEVIDGHDISAFLKGIPGTHRPPQFLLHFPHGRHNNELFTTWTDGSWKLIYQYAERKWELFNVATDIGESHDLIAEKPELALAMAHRMMDALKARGAQFPVDESSGREVRPDLAALESAVKP